MPIVRLLTYGCVTFRPPEQDEVARDVDQEPAIGGVEGVGDAAAPVQPVQLVQLVQLVQPVQPVAIGVA